MKKRSSAVFTSALPSLPRRGRGRHAFTLSEVLISLMLFVLMTLMFAAILPVAARSARYGNGYAQAVGLINHKIDQIQEAGFNRVDGASLLSLGIVDSNPNQSGPIYNYAFTSRDGLLGYFPAGSTGTIRFEPWSPSVQTVGGTAQPATILLVTITINWREGSKAPSSLSMKTLLTRMFVA